MDMIRRIRRKIHDFFNPSLEDVIRKFSMVGDTRNLTPEQIEELYELIDSFGTDDSKGDSEKTDAGRAPKNDKKTIRHVSDCF